MTYPGAQTPEQRGGSFRQEPTATLPGSSPHLTAEQEPPVMMSPTPEPAETGRLLRVATVTGLAGRVGTCTHPILLTGRSVLVERGTGRVVNHPGTGGWPARVVALRCRGRRAAVCPSCSALYRLDAYHLIAAGLRGGKDTPATVADRPRLFVTLTAPSFGPVHLGPDRHGRPRCCHPRSRRRPARWVCGRWHPSADPAIGTPLDPGGYDYPGQVLFNAHAGLLWARFATETRRALAAAARLPRRVAAARVRVVFAKVAEFQTRGVVHFHAIIRLDGPDGPGADPPSWATTVLLDQAIRIAVTRVQAVTPGSHRVRARRLCWGRQLDVRPISGAGTPLEAVAAYVAKYATKVAETTGVEVGPIFCRTCEGLGIRPGPTGMRIGLCPRCAGTGRRPGVSLRHLSGHARALVATCWWLGGQPAFAGLRLRRWAHTVGFRGHFVTKSRSYSTTMGALRGERREWTNAQQALRSGVTPASVVVMPDWHYAGPDNRGRSA